jgi:WD40 repeat protein
MQVELDRICELPPARRVFFHPDGNILATYLETHLPASNLVQAWDIGSGKLLREIEIWKFINCFGYKYYPREICFSRDLNTIIVGTSSCEGMSSSDPREIHVMDVSTGKDLAVLPGHNSDIMSVAISPDGKYLASGTWANKIKIWDLRSNKEMATLESNGSVDALAFSPDGSALASGAGMNRKGAGSDVIVWGTSSWTKTLELVFGPYVHTVDFSPNAKVLAVGGGLPYSQYSSACLKTFDMKTGNVIRTLLGGADVPREHQCIEGLSFGPSGDLLASGSDDNFVRLWDLKSGENIKEVDMGEHVEDVAFSPDGSLLASAQASLETGRTSVWRVKIDQGAARRNSFS